jgi:hypothetical protein
MLYWEPKKLNSCLEGKKDLPCHALPSSWAFCLVELGEQALG